MRLLDKKKLGRSHDETKHVPVNWFIASFSSAGTGIRNVFTRWWIGNTTKSCFMWYTGISSFQLMVTQTHEAHRLLHGISRKYKYKRGILQIKFIVKRRCRYIKLSWLSYLAANGKEKVSLHLGYFESVCTKKVLKVRESGYKIGNSRFSCLERKHIAQSANKEIRFMEKMPLSIYRICLANSITFLSWWVGGIQVEGRIGFVQISSATSVGKQKYTFSDLRKQLSC